MTKEANETFLDYLQSLLEDEVHELWIKNIYRQTDSNGDPFLCVEQIKGETVIVRVGA